MRNLLKLQPNGTYHLATNVGTIHFPDERAAVGFLDRLNGVANRQVTADDLLTIDRRKRPAGDLDLKAQIALTNSVKVRETPRHDHVAELSAKYLAEAEQSDHHHLPNESARRRAVYEANAPAPAVQQFDDALVNAARQNLLITLQDARASKSDVLRAQVGVEHAKAGNAKQFQALRDDVLANRQQLRDEGRRAFEARQAEQRAFFESQDRAFTDAYELEGAKPQNRWGTASHAGYLDQSDSARLNREDHWRNCGWDGVYADQPAQEPQ